MTSNNLRKLLANLLSDYNAYYGDNTGEMVDDYKINYQLPNFTLDEGQRSFRLEIDVWTKDNIKVDTLVEELETILDYQSHKINKWATFILETVYAADEESLYRKTMTYQVRTYEGEQ